MKLIAGVPLLLVGLALLVLGAKSWINHREFTSRARAAMGRVVGHVSAGPRTTTRSAQANREGSNPEIEFTTEKGQTVRFTSVLSSSTLEDEEAVPVLYLAEDPGRAEVNLPTEQSAWIAFVVGLGLACLVIGAVLIVGHFRSRS